MSLLHLTQTDSVQPVWIFLAADTENGNDPSIVSIPAGKAVAYGVEQPEANKVQVVGSQSPVTLLSNQKDQSPIDSVPTAL